MRVLVADDHDLVRETIAAFLEREGFDEVRMASTLDEALAATKASGAFDLVLIDYDMPGMNGLETVRAIKNLHTQTALFVLMVTAHRRQDLIKGAEELGIQYVLSKPVSASLLVDSMMHIMGHAQQCDAAPPRACLCQQRMSLRAVHAAKRLIEQGQSGRGHQ